MHDLAEILGRLDPRDLVRKGESSVWALSSPRFWAGERTRRLARIASAKDEVIRLFQARRSFIRSGDSPLDEDVPGSWVEVADRTWRMPSELDLENPNTRYWLFALGGWELYSAPDPVLEGWPDVFGCRPEALTAFLSHNLIEALVASSADDTDWTIAYG